MKLKQIQYISLSIILLFGIVFYTPMKSFAQDSNTNASIKINSGALTLYPGDSNPDNDICSNSNISYTIANPGTPIVTEGVTCSASENSISLGSVSTLPVRQNPTAIIDDVLFDDLRGENQAGYAVTAEISNFADYNNNSNVIVLGSNPDGAAATLDPGIISSISIVDGGTGYNDAPVVSFSGGNGSGATATATVSGGVVTKINVKTYGTGYMSAPTITITPTNGGSGAAAIANIVEKDSNLNPQTSNPEEKVFVTLDPSVGAITKLKPNTSANPASFTTGPRSLVTSATTQYTLFNTTGPVLTGRYDLDGTLFGLRTPAYIPSGDYRSVITLTIVADSGIVNNPPVISDGLNGGAPNSTIVFYQGSFTSHYTDRNGDPLSSVTILSLPSVGILKLNGINVNINDVIPLAQLDNLTYDANNSDYSTTFNWKASDGIDDSNTAIFTIEVSAPQQ